VILGQPLVDGSPDLSRVAWLPVRSPAVALLPAPSHSRENRYNQSEAIEVVGSSSNEKLVSDRE
jgi:hypothetical protein